MKKMMIVVAVVAMSFAACGKKKDAAVPMPPAGDGSATMPAGDGSAAPAGDGSAAPAAEGGGM